MRIHKLVVSVLLLAAAFLLGRYSVRSSENSSRAVTAQNSSASGIKPESKQPGAEPRKHFGSTGLMTIDSGNGGAPVVIPIRQGIDSDAIERGMKADALERGLIEYPMDAVER